MPLFFELSTTINLLPLNEKRAAIIREKFKHIADPSTPINLPAQLLVASNANTKETIIVGDNQTNYVRDQITDRVDLSRFSIPLMSLIDQFALDDNFNATCTMRWIFDSKYMDGMRYTKEKIQDEFITQIIDVFPNISGIGYRFLDKSNEDEISEFKIEPLIADSSKLFIESINNFKNTNFSALIPGLEKIICDLDTKVSYLEKLQKKEMIISDKVKSKYIERRVSSYSKEELEGFFYDSKEFCKQNIPSNVLLGALNYLINKEDSNASDR